MPEDVSCLFLWALAWQLALVGGINREIKSETGEVKRQIEKKLDKRKHKECKKVIKGIKGVDRNEEEGSEGRLRLMASITNLGNEKEKE